MLLTLEFFDFLPKLGTSSKNTDVSQLSFGASADGLACSGDGDNHRTCHITVYCFSLKHAVYLRQYTRVLSLSRLSPKVNRNGRKDGGQH